MINETKGAGKPAPNLLSEHYMKYDRPHIYSCSCGGLSVVTVIDGEVIEAVLTSPSMVEYLPCGHASCALKDGACIICLNGRVSP